MRNYEIMFIVNPNAADDEIDKINAQLETVITAAGGQIQKVEKMGKRRLAYEVDRFREGYYVLFANTSPFASTTMSGEWKRSANTARSVLPAAVQARPRLCRRSL